MTNYKDNLPLYAEQITINQEVEQIQEILSQFKQLVPKEFIELGQPKKYWGSTEGLEKTLCERYTFKYDNKSYTLDIGQELSDKLKLTPKDNFCVREEVLSRLPEESGITIRNEGEIFLKKSFTIDNLEKDIKGYYDKIKELKEEKGRLEKENKEVKINKRYWENKYRNEKKKSSELEEKLNSIQQELDKEKGWWDKWINDKYSNGTDTIFINLSTEAKEITYNVFPNYKYYRSDILLYNPSLKDYEKIKATAIHQNEAIIKTKEFVKEHIYQYYRDK